MTVVFFDHEQRARHKRRNIVHTLALLATMLGLLSLCAWFLGGGTGVLWAFAMGAAVLLLTPKASPRLILRLYGAREVSPAAFPQGYDVLYTLAERAGLPAVPRLFYVPSSVPAAFSMGDRETAVVAVTDGLLRILDVREFAGVLAHEVSHIRNRDLWVMSLADVVSRLTGLMGVSGVLLLVLSLPLWLAEYGTVPWIPGLLLAAAPTIGNLLQLALSRAREFDADLDAAELTGDPAGLASALRKLERSQAGLLERLLFPGRGVPIPSLLRTHPATEERVRRLLSLYAPAEVPPFPAVGLVIPTQYRVVTAPPRRRLTGLWY